MRIAVISDIHGNLEALRAVLADIEKREVDMVYCAGDIVGYGPFPNEVIALLQEKSISSVMGNYDDTIGNSRLVCGCDYKDELSARIGALSVQWTADNVTEANRQFLSRLPFEIDIATDNYSVKVVHGSPRRINEYLHRDLSTKEINRILVECTADILVCGHTHIPYERSVGNKLLVNAGSVGKPKHGDPSASYCIIEIHDITSVNIMYVSYDYDITARAIIEKGLPEELAEIIRKGTS